ncbi:MAG TPA: DUF2271 domain-containing protein [Vicinamibacterales bacterium]|nr:DUF2271 domain-containing protein [Vicinamibacterales bacterium]
MGVFPRAISRRSFLATSACAPLASVTLGRSAEYRFRYDHVIGTSLDATVWSRSPEAAAAAEQSILGEIARLSRVLSTRNPDSEIRAFEASRRTPSPPLRDVLAAYELWSARTDGALSIQPAGPGSPLNVDALGKAYIIDCALERARSLPGIDGILINIGGDIAACGPHRDISVTDPLAAYDNSEPLTRVTLQDGAIATSGTYARGGHLLDPRRGRPASQLLSATVTASDAVTANALATAACVLGPDAGLQMVERTRGAETLLVTASGLAVRSTGFARRERAPLARVAAAAGWPAGYQLTMSLTLLQTSGRGAVHRPYVGVWAEDASNKLVRVLAFWANEPKYYGELSILFNRAGRSPDRLHTLARATRSPGKYDLVWDGLDDQRAPVPAGSYKIVVETNQEGGSYAKQSGVIACGDAPADLVLSGSVNVEPIAIRYGPKAKVA